MRFATTGRRYLRWALPVLVACSLAATACSPGSLGTSESNKDGAVTLSFMVGNTEQAIKTAQQLAKDFHAANPNITVKLDIGPGGTELDNLVKTRLSTGSMDDVFLYNSGSLFQQINPQKSLLPLTRESFLSNVEDQFIPNVKAGGDVYGVPLGTVGGGGVFYNRKVYAKLGLQAPKTWAQFMANNAKIKAAGITPVIQTFGDTWTSQILVLADFHNVAAAEPDFVQRYTNNQAKYATDPAAIKGFEHLQQVHDAGYLNKDFASAKLDDGLRMVATGKGAHYPMLTGLIGQMVAGTPSAAKDVGFFALPGDDAAKNGMTTWYPAGVYIPKTTTGEKLDAARKFLGFIASKAGCDSQTRALPPTGAYMVKGCTLPSDLPQVVEDMVRYVQTPGQASPALEFLSPIKGPNLENITVEVGSGIRPAKVGAAEYDKDVKKQAQQLGLPAWQQ
jgi:raffinose/stachyose/melibiose transport system substrate-binding protein